MSKPDKADADVLIIGGGPAGMSAAVWCSDLGLSSVLVDSDVAYGGQLSSIHNPIENYIGRIVQNGNEMLTYFSANLDRAKFKRRMGVSVTSINADVRAVDLEDGTRLSASAIIVATGVRRRELAIPGERRFIGKGILRSGAKEANLVRGSRVVIIGGGDAALENALILSKFASTVYVVHRRGEFTARKEFLEEARQNRQIEFFPETNVVAIGGDSAVRNVVLHKNGTGQEGVLAVDNVLIRIGVQPNTELLRDQLDLDQRGYIIVNSRCETSRQGIYACGDVANPTSLTLSTAAGTGSTAAKNIAEMLSKSDRGYL